MIDKDLLPAKQTSSFVRLYRLFSRRRRVQLVLILVLMLIGALAEFATIGATIPFLAVLSDNSTDSALAASFGKILDVFGVSDDDYVLAAAFLFVAIAGIALIIRLLLAFVSQRFIFRVGYDLSVLVLTQILHKPYRFHTENNSSETIGNLNKSQIVVAHMLQPLMLGFTGLALSLFIIAALVFINPVIALVLVAIVALLYFIMAISIRKILRRNGVFISESQGKRVQSVQESLGAIRDIIIGNTRHIAINKFKAIDSKLRTAQATNMFIAGTPRLLVEFVAMVLIAITIIAIDGSTGGLLPLIPVIGAFVLGAQRLLPLAEQTYRGWAGAIANRQLLDDVLAQIPDQQPANPGAASAAPLSAMPFERDIVFRNVCFAYGVGKPVLHNVNLTIRKNEMVGIVGATGSGKSTLMDLILGLLSPDSGDIAIDGVSLNPANISAWQRNIAHVPQSIYLYDATIAQNIAFNVPENLIDMDRVVDAAKQANIHDAIISTPGGYNSFVGERGVRLSGGQRQRIGIARGLYSKASVLVMDEATNALDPATEANIMSTLMALKSHQTILVIAHRPSALVGCDTEIDLSQHSSAVV